MQSLESKNTLVKVIGVSTRQDSAGYGWKGVVTVFPVGAKPYSQSAYVQFVKREDALQHSIDSAHSFALAQSCLADLEWRGQSLYARIVA